MAHSVLESPPVNRAIPLDIVRLDFKIILVKHAKVFSWDLAKKRGVFSCHRGTTMIHKDYYVVLGVSPTVTTRGIQRAFRALSRQYHPDRVGPQGPSAFQDIVEAYQVLSDPERR